MKITVVSANQTAAKNIKKGKGQSLLIQAGDHNFLFDFGAEKQSVLKNLHALGISPDIVDTAFLSCGDINHSGGLPSFLFDNRRASVYARVNAFNAHYKKGAFGMKEVTPDKSLRSRRRILRCKNYFVSKDNSFVTFSLGSSNLENPANAAYFVKDEEKKFVPDDFSHEMYLLVRADKRWALFCGDAHVGIVPIVEQAQKLVQRNLGGKLEWVVGGFNLTTDKGKPVADGYIGDVAKALSDKDVTYYTGHSTGERAFSILQSVLGDRVRSYAAGDVIEL